ncbi:MAG: Ig-like domain-containing protein, partial [Planctomycetota bacterium]
MRVRRSSVWGSLSERLQQLAQRGKKRSHSTKIRARRRLFEKLENRELMALNILSVSPLDNATNVPLNSDLVFTFNQSVVKGQGNIYVVREGTGTTGIELDVNSSNVVIAGTQVTVKLPSNLELDNNYFVSIDNGAFLDGSATQTPGGIVLEQNFDFKPLKPFITFGGGDGTDWTEAPPVGWTQDNTPLPTGGATEYRGWTILDKNSWINSQGGQSRDLFTLGKGSVAVGDPDAFDDVKPVGGPFKGYLVSKPINLDGVAADSVKLDFDSSFRPEFSQVGTLEVSFNGGTTWKKLLELNPTNTDNDAPFPKKNINEHLTTGGKTGGNVDILPVGNPSSGTMTFRWYTEGGNTWWWALDNIVVSGTITGDPYTGLKDPTAWNFRTPESPKLSMSFDKQFISENGGTATGTVSRNNLPTGDVTVTLSITPAGQASIPATVFIPDGQASATFTITGIDNALSDRTRTVSVTATSTVYATASSAIKVTDDEGPKIVSLTPADNATGVDYKSNFDITFDTDVKKGAGRIYIVKSSTNSFVAEIDAASSAVTVSGKTVSINPPGILNGLTDFYVIIDDGAILDASATLNSNTVLLSQNFDLMPLSPFTTEPNGDGTDFTKKEPLGFKVDNSLMPGGSASNFNGWVFMDKKSWIATEGDQSRSRFTKASGNVAVADSDAWDDTPHNAGRMNTFLETPGIDLTGITPGSLTLEFDSSYYPELPQYGQVQVSYNDGASWSDLLFFGDAGNPNDGRNDRIVIGKSDVAGSFIGGATVDSALDSPATGTVKFRFAYREGDNNWWWAVDNLIIRGEKEGIPFSGIQDPTLWNVTTAVAPTLTVTIDKTSMSENGGIATGTVTRNLSSSGALVVNLSSNDTTEATVPATVTIPDGQFSVTFPITAVDDTLPDGTQVATITADAVDYFNVPASIDVLDDDFPKIVSVTPVDNATGVNVGTDVVVKFDQSVRKGNGFVYLVQGSNNKALFSIDVNSPQITISGDTLTVNPSMDLGGLKDYYLRIDRGAVLSTLTTPALATTLLSQDFELLPLRAAPNELAGLTPTSEDYTPNPPVGWQVDNNLMAKGGAPEWTGWTFAAKSFWQTQGGQSRANFTKGVGTIAVGDTDEWQDYSRESDNFNSLFRTSPIDLDSVQPNSVVLEFDSSFRPESGSSFVTPPPADNQQGKLDVSYDGGTTWANLLTLDTTNTLGTATAANVNERRTISVPNPDTGSMLFRWGLTGTNDWWWAIDNITVKGDTIGLPFPGLTDPTFANFTTAEAATLSVAVPASAVENAGVITGTVSRNLGTTGSVSVSLVSSNPLVGTVPATVTIPDGQASVSFDITLLDDSVYDASKNLVITASNAAFVSGKGTTLVTDNEVGDVIISEIMYDPAGAEQRTEWVEIYNRGTTVADLSGWVLDDEDKQDWGAIANGMTLDPGQVAVLYNSFYGLNTDLLFRTQWSVPATSKVIGVFWSTEDDGSNKSRGGLFNNPGAGNEVLSFRDASGAALNTVPLAEDGTAWPVYSNGSSVYLVDVTKDNTVGTNWKSARVSTDGGIRSLGPDFSTSDIGSPGWILQDASPVIGVTNAAVTGAEGTTITNSGTWSDPNVTDVVTLTANVGTVVKNADGTWSWSIAAADNVAATPVTITANDGLRGIATVSFTYAATNSAPALGVSQASVSGNVLSTLTNIGTWNDVAADTVTLTASVGTVTKNADGTWSWSLSTTVPINSQTVTITGTDEDGGSSNVTFTIDALVAVTNTKVYYKGSSFAGTGVDAALDP